MMKSIIWSSSLVLMGSLILTLFTGCTQETPFPTSSPDAPEWMQIEHITIRSFNELKPNGDTWDYSPHGTSPDLKLQLWQEMPPEQAVLWHQSSTLSDVSAAKLAGYAPEESLLIPMEEVYTPFRWRLLDQDAHGYQEMMGELPFFPSRYSTQQPETILLEAPAFNLVLELTVSYQ